MRIHTGTAAAESARAVGADAYTYGRHVVFGEGRFQPATSDGRQLLAHELAHVVQQEGAGVADASPTRLDQPQDASEQWAEQHGRSALEGSTFSADTTSTVGTPTVQRQKTADGEQADVAASNSTAGASAPAAASGGWAPSDAAVNFDISIQNIRDASFFTAGRGGVVSGGPEAWSNRRVFSFMPPERAWLHTAYWADTKEHPLPAEYAKFSVTNDIRFTTSTGQTTTDAHYVDTNPLYRGPGVAVGPKLGFTAPGNSDLPILELPLNQAGTLSWRAGFRFPGVQSDFSAEGKFQVRADSAPAPNPPAGLAPEGPARAPADGIGDKPAPKGTPLPPSPKVPKAPPAKIGEIEAISELIRRTTEAAKRDPLISRLRDALAGIQPFLPPGEAKKLIDEALESLIKDSVTDGIKKILETLAGKGPTTMPENRSPTGPATPEKDLHQQILKGPKIPWDIGVKPRPKLFFEYKNGPRKSYAPGEAIKFTVVPPDNFDALTGAKRVVIVAAADSSELNPTRIGKTVPLETGSPKQVELTAPTEPGKYVIRIDIGLGPDTSSIQEFEVTGPKK